MSNQQAQNVRRDICAVGNFVHKILALKTVILTRKIHSIKAEDSLGTTTSLAEAGSEPKSHLEYGTLGKRLMIAILTSPD